MLSEWSLRRSADQLDKLFVEAAEVDGRVDELFGLGNNISRDPVIVEEIQSLDILEIVCRTDMNRTDRFLLVPI